MKELELYAEFTFDFTHPQISLVFWNTEISYQV